MTLPLQSRAMTDRMALFMAHTAPMPGLVYKVQGHAFTRQEVLLTFKPFMHTFECVCGPSPHPHPISFPSSIMYHRLAGKVPRLETVHMTNNPTLLMRVMKRAGFARRDHSGPHRHHGAQAVLPGAYARDPEARPARTLESRQGRAVDALIDPQQWVFDVSRRPLACSNLETAFRCGCILASDAIQIDTRRRVTL